MANIIDYAEHTFYSLTEQSLGAVDSLILSQFSYLNLPKERIAAGGMQVRDLLCAELFDGMLARTRVPAENLRLLVAMAASPRFRTMQLVDFTDCRDAVQEEQFAAVTLRIDPHTLYVAFRGTDATFLGWKEDFNMAFCDTVPSQQQAAAYLDEIASREDGNIITGGHSKGGNLALYAAAMCHASTRKRVIAAYCHDGPGFREDVFSKEGFHEIEPIVQKTVPQSSIIGMVFESHEAYHIVHSDNKSIMQHDPYSWTVQDGDFLYEPRLSAGAIYTNRTIANWIAQLSDEERELLVNTMYRQLNGGDLERIKDFGQNWRENTLAVITSVHNTNADVREAISEMLKKLMVQMVENSAPRAGIATVQREAIVAKNKLTVVGKRIASRVKDGRKKPVRVR